MDAPTLPEPEQTGLLVFHQYFEKAEPKTEGDHRFVHCVASNESKDLDNERVLSSALRDSADYFLQKGNIDIDHLTKIGHRVGIANPHLFEIGQPREVTFDDRRTFVKAEIYQGAGKSAERANIFWDSITAQSPPQRWFPSVAGSILQTSKAMEKGEIVKVIEKVRWNNLAFAKEPVNQTVPEVSLQQITKSLSFLFGKTLTAGPYCTDAASLTGGGAVRAESGGRKLRIAHIVHEFRKGTFFKNLGIGYPHELTRSSLQAFYRAVIGLSTPEARRHASDDITTINNWRSDR